MSTQSDTVAGTDSFESIADEVMPFIKEIKALPKGASFNVVALIKSKMTKTTGAGKPFLSVEFSDSSGSMGGMLWGDGQPFAAVDPVGEGAIARVTGKTDVYNGGFAIKVNSVDILGAEVSAKYTGRLTAVSHFDGKTMSDQFNEFFVSITDPQIKITMAAIFKEVGAAAFLTSPAAKSMHHAWRGGLLEHTLTMLKLAEAIIPIYPNLKINRDILIASIAMHDLCKVIEYTQTLECRVTTRGLLIGHISLMYGLLVKHAALTNLPQATTDAIAHAILSHHGKLEYGSPVLAATPEAIIMSMIDLMDSRMGALQSTIRSDGDKDVTPYNRAFETQVVLNVAS